MKHLVRFLPAALLAAVLAGCGSSAPAAEAEASGTAQTANTFEAVQFDEDGNVVIETDAITETATYLNYDGGDATVQLLAVRASDGTVRLAYNTCQVCSPSPKAYFVQKGDAFVCQNCGNRFTTDEVGLEAFGCNPTTVDGVTEADGVLTVDAAGLADSVSKFVNWQGPTA